MNLDNDLKLLLSYNIYLESVGYDISKLRMDLIRFEDTQAYYLRGYNVEYIFKGAIGIRSVLLSKLIRK